jgi:hypothetical protein
MQLHSHQTKRVTGLKKGLGGSGLGLYARDECVQCSGAPPSCNCAAGEDCVLTSR